MGWLVAEIEASVCTCCAHPQCAEIDAALLGGTTLRDVAGTFGLSRSSVGRHRQNHLTAAGAVKATGAADGPMRPVDVHKALSDVAARLNAAMEAAERSRKPAVVVATSRELRQTLEAIARLQTDPELAKAATGQLLEQVAAEGSLAFIEAMIRFVLNTAGVGDDVFVRLVGKCWRVVDFAGNAQELRDRVWQVDRSDALAWVQRRDELAKRAADAEVERRVVAEVGRRMAELRVVQPALEAAPAVVPVHDGPDAPVVSPKVIDGQLDGSKRSGRSGGASRFVPRAPGRNAGDAVGGPASAEEAMRRWRD